MQQLENFQRQTAAYSRTASCLHQRAQTTAQLLSDTLSLREQTIAKNQAENMANLNKSIYWITTMGLLYLPTTLVATIFGTNFFGFDGQSSKIIASTDICITYLTRSIPNTTVVGCGILGSGVVLWFKPPELHFAQAIFQVLNVEAFDDRYVNFSMVSFDRQLYETELPILVVRLRQGQDPMVIPAHNDLNYFATLSYMSFDSG
ncbi:hypothetical protein E0Z10_g9538 [Xylaria hypoxylon]|uniref:Uncharacterized protein n=1 Tax=Xylaria hypoxylon TaxID=37992 RepID=A0A4Z0YIX4_9PEZI|nr:hypothetical protein E0Z10_g9538 [Xylaria hypoxylon]